MLIRHQAEGFGSGAAGNGKDGEDLAYLRPLPSTVEVNASIRSMMAAAAPPVACGPAVPVAPARAFRVTDPMGVVPKGVEDWDVQPIGYRGRSVMVVCDVFDQMLKAEMDRCRTKGEAYVPPFTPGQIAVGRSYRDLVERHEASGMRCSQLQGGTRGGIGGAGVSEAQLQDARQISGYRRRIGHGAALAVRRIRPSARGAGARGTIMDRALVDMVCIAGMTLSEVLRAHGWAEKGESRNALRKALASVLERMRG